MIPRPTAVRIHDGSFVLDAETTLEAPPTLAGVAGWLRGVLGPATGCWLPAGSGSAGGTGSAGRWGSPGRGGISLAVAPDLDAEGYRVEVERDGVSVCGGSAAGVFYGLQTLRQLLPPAVYRRGAATTGPWVVPAASIADGPRFAWRGCLLDVARHFLPKADVLRFLDLLALHKINVLHLHLTDDQGWRFEVPGWPRLTQVGAWRRESMVGARRNGRLDGRPHGGFYTAEDLREIVAYAADRFITVVPEVDLPGHVGAALAAYPELGNTGQASPVRTGWGIFPDVLGVDAAAMTFCRDVLDAVCDVFPGDYVCIGGDECPTAQWQESPAAKARAAQLGLSGPEALQSWFTTELAAHLAGRGRRVLAWDEVLDSGAPSDLTIAAWRGPGAILAAARAGHAVVVCPEEVAYLDHRQSSHPDEPVPVGSLITLEDVYALQPVPAELDEAEAHRVIGVQANIWTEHLDSARAVDYMAFPRLCALAEVAWSGPGHDVADFAGRLRVHKGRLRALGVEYRRDNGPMPWQTRPDARGWYRT